MQTQDLHSRIRRIQITTSRLVTDIFAGQYHSAFKGRGIEFEEVREYQIGDDVRAIDWNVTARTGKPHIKKFVEERELTVMLMVDVSASNRFGSVREMKSKLAAEAAAVLAFSAIRNNDKVGLIIFSAEVEKYIPPRRGVQHVLRVIREVLYFSPKKKQTDISVALEFLNKVIKRQSVTFLISDFLEPGLLKPEGKMSPRLRTPLMAAHRRHDVVAVTLSDPAESVLPSAGLLFLEDAETGQSMLIDSQNEGVRKKYHEAAVKRQNARSRLFRSLGIDHINISTGGDFVDELVKFFSRRRKRRRLG